MLKQIQKSRLRQGYGGQAKLKALYSKKIEILGVKLNIIDLEYVLQIIEQAIERRQFCHLVTLNPEIVMLGQKDKAYQNLLNNATIAMADGVGLVWASRFLLGQKIPGIAGVDLVWQLAKVGQKNRWRFYLLGGRGDVAERAARGMRQKYPQLHIVGAESGGEIDPQKEYPQLIPRLRKSKPDIMLVALGAPRQEQFISRNQKIINVPVAIGIGGAFDFISGKVRRAPKWLQRIGLEWFWRLIIEPWRWRRQLQLLKFVWLVLKQKYLRKSLSS